MRKAEEEKARRGEEEKRRENPWIPSPFSFSPLLLFSLSPLLFACLAVGCESGFGSRRQGDPLLGIQTPATPQPAPIPPSSTPPAQASAGQVPPLPATYSAPGTVPVAGGETATPENGRDLRMTTSPLSPTSLPTSGAARGVAPAVTVGNPEPVPPAGTTANLATSPPLGAASNIRTFDDAQRYLKQRGVSFQRFEMEEDGRWKFECSIPNPANPKIGKTYVTNTKFSDPLSAMQAVIGQIEQSPR
ncbi:MAG: hypothetical protein ACYC3I_09520 [Gemmataceae bacterium]